MTKKIGPRYAVQSNVSPIPKRLILFDVDGTLIDSGKAGTRSLNKAFYELFGIKDAFVPISMAGKTDIEIIKEGLKLHGVPEKNDNLEMMVKMYLQFLEDEIENPRRRIKPGIKKLLGLLSEMGMPLGLLTGNLERGARIKLSPFGLNKYFLDGAFGSDHEDRNKLLPIAIQKFSKRGFNFSSRECIVIGDTPRDVKCAKIHGAYCIAVVTGPYSKESLLNTEADIVLDSLADSEKCLNFIRNTF
jgi:phosphoglycolate phosphatase-like HAD superfamily hydrolase